MSDYRQIKPNIGHSEAASGIFTVMKVRGGREWGVGKVVFVVWAAGTRMTNDVIVASFDPSSRKIAVDGIRRQDAPSITSSHIVLPARRVTNRTISQTPPPSLSFEQTLVDEDELLSGNFLHKVLPDCT